MPSIKKHFRVAIYTSPVISILIVTPIFILSQHNFSMYFNTVWLGTIVIFLLWSANILLQYFINKWKIGRKSTIVKYIISYLISILFTVVGSYWFSLHSSAKIFDSHQVVYHFHLIIFFAINTVILILQDLLVTRERNMAMEIENTHLRMKNVEAINQQLKQQIQPHFLFNSLSTLKALMKNAPENAEEYLIRLSDLLRFSLSSHTLNTVKLDIELKLCTDYLEMQKIRFGEALKFTINIPDTIGESCYLPVFSLQLLAENAIKHNILTIEAPLHLNIDYLEGLIIVSNNLQKKDIKEGSAGMGLQNLQERYKILSGEKIWIDSSDNKFLVGIKVLEYESSNH